MSSFESMIQPPGFDKPNSRVMMYGFWMNNETKKVYFVYDCTMDATTAHDGQMILHYMDSDAKRFSREIAEFKMKFTPMLNFEQACGAKPLTIEEPKKRGRKKNGS